MRGALYAALISILMASQASSQAASDSFARQHPDSIRSLIAKQLSQAAVARSTIDRSNAINRAKELARDYDRAWSDAFHIREVDWFASLTQSRQRDFVTADSLRRAGNDLLATKGAPDALRVLRASLKLAEKLAHPAAVSPILTSLAGGYYREGELDSAALILRRTESIARASGDLRTLGNIVGLSASVQKDQGDVTRALESYKRATAIRARSGDNRGIAADENNIGTIYLAQGSLDNARAAFNRALVMNRLEQRDRLVGLNLLNIGIVDRIAGNLDRAEASLRDALKTLRAGGGSSDEPLVNHELGKVYAETGDYEKALSALRTAVRGYRATGANSGAIEAQIDISEVEGAIGNPQAARSALSDATQLASREEDSPQLLGRIAMTRADLAVGFSSFAQAETDYSAAMQFFRTSDDTVNVARALEGLAFLAYRRTNNDSALTLIRRANKLYAAINETRSASLGSLLEANIQYERGDSAASRRILATARSDLRGIGDKVGEAAALAELGDVNLRRDDARAAIQNYRSGLSVLGKRRASDVEQRLHYGLGTALQLAGQTESAVKELRSAIALSESEAATLHVDHLRSAFLADKWSVYERLALLEKSRRRASDAFAVSELMRSRQLLDMLARGSVPRNAKSVATPSVQWKQVAAKLSSDQALIEYLVSDSSSVAFVITRDTIAAIEIPESRERIANLVEFTRKAMNPAATIKSRALWKKSLRSLYTTLITPIEKGGLLRGKRNLLIVPHEDLYFLSFASLMEPGNADKFLVERFDISYAPSAAIWMELSKRPQTTRRGSVIALAPNISRLPGSRAEVENVARIYGSSALAHYGADATRASLQRDLAKSSVIHLATFGVFNKRNPLFSFVSLAPSAKDDGRLEVHDVFGLPLNGQTVVLSACQSAVGSGALADVPAGDDWVGLMQAFLSAGARSVVATLWPIDDRATSELMTEFHRQLARGKPTSVALASAQREMIRTSKSNPAYWAGFTLSGRGE